jgi:multisubunit Na+/H+ antiporter MnhB subunit
MGTVVLGLTAVLAGALAVTYLLVACQSLPSLLGPVAGDTHPRTKLGAAFLLLAVLLAGGAVMTARLRRDRR